MVVKFVITISIVIMITINDMVIKIIIMMIICRESEGGGEGLVLGRFL